MTGAFIKFLLALLLVPLFILAWFITSTEGLRWAYQQAEFYLPGIITLNSLDGSLIGPITITGLEYSDNGATYRAARLTLDWQPSSLLSARVVINQFSIHSLHIVLPETDPLEMAAQPQEPLVLPDINLPWRTVLKQAYIDDLMIRQNDQIFQFEQVRLNASTLFNRMDIDELTILADTYRLNLSGKLQLAHLFSHHIKLNWQTELPSGAVVNGKGQLTGDLLKTQLRQTLSGPMQLNISAELNDLLEQLNWSAQIDVAQFDAQKLDAALPPLSGKFNLNADGDLKTAKLSGNLNGHYPDIGKFDAIFKLRLLADKSILIDRLNLQSPVSGTELKTRGSWKPGPDGGDVMLTLDWKKLRWPLQDKPWFNSASGDGFIEGNINHYQFHLSSDSPWPEVIPFAWQARAEGNLQSLTIHSLLVSNNQGIANAKGRLNWSPDLTWQVEVDASGIDPSIYLADWPGHLDARLVSEGRREKDDWVAAVEIERLTGKLRDYPVSLSGNLKWHNNLLDIRKLELNSAATRVKLNGQAGDRLNLDWSVVSSDLSGLYPGVKGRLDANGQLSGLTRTPTINATFSASELAYPDYAASSLEGSVNVDMSEWYKAEFTLAARSLLLKNNLLESIDIKAEKQHIVANATSARLSTQIELKGEAHAEGWRGMIQRADIQTQRYSNWQLGKPGALTIDLERIKTESLCWRNPQQAELCGTLIHEDNDWKSTLTLQQLPLMLFSEWLPEDLKLDGMANAGVELHLSGMNALQGKAHIDLPAGRIAYPLLDEDLEQWKYRHGKIDLSLNGEGLQATSEIVMQNGDELKGELKLAGLDPFKPDLQNNPVQGRVQLKVQDLSQIELLIPEISKSKGELLLDLSTTGTLAQPRMVMDIQLQNASLQIPRLGLKIEQVSLTSQSEAFEKLKFQLNAKSATGSLVILGETQLDYKAGWPTKLSLKGQDFEVSRIPEARVLVSPDLTITLARRSIDIKGTVHVPFADLQPRDITTATRVSDDVVIIGDERVLEEKWLITTRVRLTLGERVKFFGFGFEGRLGGTLLLEDEPGQFTRATGEINIPEGRYRAYGQRLDIEQGRLLYTGGPITNPGLDLRAVRHINEVTAGITVKGSLNQPQLDLFSTPAMGQTDALAYLLMGRPIENASGEDGAIMAKAALALGLSGGDHIARGLKDRFGLDDMRVESNDTGDQASLVIGRYLSPRLYVSYGVGLIESVNTLSVRYKLSEKWQLKAESGEYQGADIIYTFER